MRENKNLDALCAKYGWDIANDTKDDTLINKALGVLQKQGIYAFFLFLESQGGTSEKKNAEKISKHCWGMLKETTNSIKDKEWKSDNWSKTLRENLLNDLDNLSLALQLLEQTLIYARYHAKALKEK